VFISLFLVRSPPTRAPPQRMFVKSALQRLFTLSKSFNFRAVVVSVTHNQRVLG